MKIIKFRAWDNERNIMYYSDKELDDFFFEIHGETLKAYRIEKDCGSIHEPPQAKSEEIPDELMQFTGLLDKNGKEIWEGDIVRITEGYITDLLYKSFIGYVDYDLDSPPGFYINQSKNIEKTGKWCGQDYNWNDIEIIGNLYENPQLLK